MLLNLLSSSFRLLIRNPLVMRPNFAFSQYFRDKDLHDLWEYNDRKVINKKYRSLLALWKRPLQKKKLRQARIAKIKQNLKKPQPQPQKLVVHNPAIGIKTPTADSIFAIVKVDNRQFKVTQDCMIILDKKPEHEVGKQINFQEVLLVGTETYTSLGRPKVQGASVIGIIESISSSQKIIVFKKKRRKQYKKSFGARSTLTSVRIVKVAHDLSQQVLVKAVSLQ